MAARDIVELVWTQAWQLTILTSLVWLVVRWLGQDRPHLAHTLWLVVLLKCVTLPIWSSPVGVFSWLQRELPAEGVERPQSLPISETIENELAVAARPRPEYAASESNGAPVPAAHSPRVLPDPACSNTPPTFDRWNGLLVIWISGAALCLAASMMRVALFALRLSRRPVRDHVEVVACVRRLSRQLAIRRRVRAVVTDSRIGPAVFGWRRPTIVLPSAVVENKSAIELEPLVAHELIHIRRGDLTWAMLQTVATSVWWFHPLVWIASRMLTREAERCCDEEVVASLDCKPALYARGLLDVLERKHRLHSAPLLPGVRAVDITSSRLERIMQLGQGSRRRTPWWCWTVLGVAAFVALPGAAFTSAEETKPTTAAGTFPPAPPLPQPDALVSPFIARIDVRNVLQRLAADIGLEGEQAALELATIVASPTPHGPTPETAERSVVITVPAEGQARKLTLAHSGIRIIDGTLYMFGTSEHRQQVRERIQRLRKFGFRRLTISARLVSAAPDALENLWAEAGPVGSRDSDKERSGAGSTPLYLREKQLSQFLNAAQADARINLFQLPPVTLFNGERTTVSALTKQPFVVGLNPSQGENSKQSADYEPTIRVVEEGARLTLQPVLGDGQRVRLECSLVVSKIRDVATAEMPQGTSGDTATVQVPEVGSRYLETALDIPLGQTVVVNGFRQKNADGKQSAMLVLLTCKQADQDPQRNASNKSPVAEVSDHSRVVIQGPTVAIGTTWPDNPPTDAQLIEILIRRDELDDFERQAIAPRGGSMRIVKEKTADYFDPIRKGEDGRWLRRHHRHYRCVLYTRSIAPRASAGTRSPESDTPNTIGPSPDAQPRVLYIAHIHDHVISVESSRLTEK